MEITFRFHMRKYANPKVMIQYRRQCLVTGIFYPLFSFKYKIQTTLHLGAIIMWVIGYIVLGCLVFAGALLAVISRRLLPAVVSLGIGSAVLATLFFWLGAPYAGGFELSVGAGLISVLFLIIISLTETMGGKPDEE